MIYCSSENSFSNSSSRVNENLEKYTDSKEPETPSMEESQIKEEDDSEDITATRPVVISGAYLTCQTSPTNPDETSVQVSCHFEKDGSIIEGLVINEEDVSFTINNAKADVNNFKNQNGVFTFDVAKDQIEALTISVNSIDGEAIGEDEQSTEPTKTVVVLAKKPSQDQMVNQEPQDQDNPQDEGTTDEGEPIVPAPESDGEEPEPLMLSNLTVSTGKTYQIQNSAAINSELYIDRTYYFTSLGEFEGSMYIQTSNEDDGELTDSLITFNVNRSSEVLVLFDVRADSLPTWLASWELLPAIIETNDTDFNIYRKIFSQSELVSIGSNYRINTDARSNLVVFIRPN